MHLPDVLEEEAGAVFRVRLGASCKPKPDMTMLEVSSSDP
jgi:hypothetical protein